MKDRPEPIRRLLTSSVSFFLGLRYLRPKRNFVSLITVVSILGVMLGVGILTAVVAIMTGYSIKMRETVLGFQPHLVVNHSGVLYEWGEVMETVKKHPEVNDAQPFSHGQVALDFNRKLWVVSVRGFNQPWDRSPEEEIPAIEQKLQQLVTQGEFDLTDDYIVIGKALAEKMGIGIGDVVDIHSLANGREIFSALKKEGEQVEMDEYIPAFNLPVTGIFDSGRHDFDREFVFIPLEIGQTLYNLRGGVHGLMLDLEDPYRAEIVQQELLEVVEPPLAVSSWIEMNQSIFEMVAMERLLMVLMLSIIMVVAGFCIMNTMITVTTMKRREIGLLKALGARMDQIAGVFMGQGFVVGMLGAILGLGGAFFFLCFRQKFMGWLGKLLKMEVFSEEVYHFYELPAKLTMIDIACIAGGAFLACAVAALLPAYFAARLDAAKALRNESRF